MTEKMSRVVWVVLSLLLAGLLLAACGGGEKADDVSWTTYENGDMGFSIDVPEDWQVEVGDASGLIVSLTHPTEDVGAIVFVLNRADLPSFGAENAQDLLGLFVAQALSDEASVTIVQAVQPATINGQAGATAVLQGELGGQMGLISFTAVAGESKVVILSTGDGTEGEFEALLGRMRESISVD
jgi:ABC-type amino acid transport substrate-binding protein